MYHDRQGESALLTRQRKQLILERLRRDGQVIAKAISHEMGLSEDTIRKDLRELAREGHLLRVHGGALPASPAVADYAGRQQLASDGKVAIGRAAARMIQSGQGVILDGWTTALQVARHLPPGLPPAVVTHSPTIAVALVEHQHVEVVVIGGRLFKHSIVTVGAGAAQSRRAATAPTFFFGW